MEGAYTIPNDGATIPCHVLDVSMDPVKLPALPDLPDLPATGPPEEERREATKLVKIATMLRGLIGLTNKGHVLKMDDLDKEESVRSWRYVSESVRGILCLF